MNMHMCFCDMLHFFLTEHASGASGFVGGIFFGNKRVSSRPRREKRHEARRDALLYYVG